MYETLAKLQKSPKKKKLSSPNKYEEDVKYQIFKNHNVKKVFQVLRELGIANRAEITRKTGIARTTVYDALCKLTSMDWVIKFSRSPSKGKKGRPQTFYRINTAPPISIPAKTPLKTTTIPMGLFIVKFVDKRPVLLIDEGLHILNTDKIGKEDFFKRHSGYYQIGLGQGQSPMKGFYGPVPVCDHSHLLAYLYGFFVQDEGTSVAASRPNKQSLGCMILLIDKSHEQYLPTRVKLEKILNRLFRTVQNVKDINRMFLLTVKMMVQREICQKSII